MGKVIEQCLEIVQDRCEQDKTELRKVSIILKFWIACAAKESLDNPLYCSPVLRCDKRITGRFRDGSTSVLEPAEGHAPCPDEAVLCEVPPHLVVCRKFPTPWKVISAVPKV